jgi:cyclopropane-fatty-acyl-phospholipid synthase
MDSVPSTTAGFAPGFFDDWCLSRLATFLHGAPVRLELWNKSAIDPALPRVATVVIKDRGTLLRLLRRPALEFGEAYSAGRLVVKGDLVCLLEAVNKALAGRPLEPPMRRAAATTAAARENVHQHYDLGNEFYRLWLDDAMVYTCAYFDHPDVTLEDAQRAKLEYVCRKLRLRAGDRVIEAGCGWGALALYMAKHYDVTVRAFNVSDEQLRYARDRAAREGLSDRVTFVDGDYRTIEGRCDAFVSVGMLEHVGPAHYADLGGVIDRVLDPNHGRGLLHFIGRNAPMEFNSWIARHIFPGAYAPTLGEVLPRVFEPANVSVFDIENLRRHYALTLKHWLERFERHVEPIRLMFDDAFVRTWRLYLASAQAGFTTGDLQLFQVTFGRASDAVEPWTRRALYEPDSYGPM